MENFDMISCMWAVMNSIVPILKDIIALYIVMDLIGSILFNKGGN